MKILIVNGPNLNLLGKREPEIYGKVSMESVLQSLREEFPPAEIDFYQSNSEGAIIDRLQQEDFDALIINPGAFTHYSYAIADCLKNISVPKIEVHISNIYQREEFRRKSVTAEHCNAVLSGFGTDGYRMSVEFLMRNIK
ncbi:type II 3-dehydroquinate dehydratase [Cruoricaptor ignavus]|uniref:type II 3-dehydroquinate dehydratase n=1 Tax=Cruoricaptor ignavus TaxID=1118202 RepID=UPI00370D6F96